MKANTLLSKPISYSNVVNICALLILTLAASQASAVGSAKRTYSGTDGVLTTFFYQCTACHTGDGAGVNKNWDNYTQTTTNYGDTTTWGITYRVFTTNDAPMYTGNALNTSHLTGWNTDGRLNYDAPYIATGSNGSNTRNSANNYSKAVSFTVNENGSNTTFTAYYRISGAWNSVAVTSPAGTGGGDTGSNTTANATLTGLTCGSTWTYYLSGTNSGGTSSGQASNSNTFSITCNTGASISGSPGAATEDSLFTWTPTITAGTGGSDNLTFSFSSGPTVTGGNTANVPSINSSSGQVSWTPTEGNASASFTIQVSDSLADTSITDTLVVNITANAINDNNPVITTNGPLAATENTLMSTQINATDVDGGDTETWDITASDDVDIAISTSGLLTWTPAEGDGLIGSFDVTVRVTDAGANQTSKTLTINVASDNTAPSITSTPATQSATEDTLFSVDLNATDPDASDTQNWSITSPVSLPDDMAIDTNGTLSWTPGEGIDRTQSVTVRVTDSGGLFDEVSFDIDVTSVNDAPVISVTIPDDSVEEHSAFSYAVQVTDSDPQDNSPDLDSNMTYSITNISPTPTSTTPSIDATGLISWTPGNNDARSVSPTALSQDYVISVSVEDGGENAQGAATQDFTVTVTLQDGDSDTVPDYEDNCPVDANTLQENNDGDAEGDICDPDDDNDGISDIAENFNGLDPFSDADALLDLDSDGLDNLTEFNTCTGSDINSLLTCDNIQIDSVPPIITHNGDFNVLAAGYTTFIDFSATATDGVDGVVSVTADTSNKFFRPGDNIVTWTAQDAVPNIAIEEQYITIHPLVSLGGSQVLAEGSSGIANINFSGDIPLADFPVSITYVTSGSAVGSDYNITPASPIVLNSQADLTNGQVALNITANNDGAGEGNETLTITLNSITSGPAFALDTAHQVMITEAQIAPTLDLTASQNGIDGNSIYGDQGTVTVNANAVDGNGDLLSYDWSGSDAALGGSGVGGAFTFNPNGISTVIPESFTVNVVVNDGTTSVSQSLSLVYVADSLALGASDTDGDGVDDATEGLIDSDGDGLPDYLDAYDNASNLLFSGNVQGSDEGPEFIQTESGLVLSLGALGMESNVSSPNINLIKMSNQGLISTDTGYVHFGSIYDFTISGLSLISLSAQVVIPSDQGITPEAEIRLYDPVLGVWFSFVANAGNYLSSAEADENGCPPSGDASYTNGLNAFHHCIQITLTDGGPNDLDGEINGQIVLIAGLAVADTADLFEPVIIIDESNLFGSDGPAGTGSMGITFLTLLISALGTSFFHRRRKANIHGKQKV